MGLMLLPVEGELRGGEEGAALLLAPSSVTLSLGFAIPTLSGEHQVLPEVVLDDWGSERRGAALYQWIRDEGAYFPRAELFGVDPTGAKRQFFLRELDLIARYHCFAFPSAEGPFVEATRVRAICQADALSVSPRRTARPQGLHFVLGLADISWWAVSPAHFHDFDIRQLLPLDT